MSAVLPRPARIPPKVLRLIVDAQRCYDAGDWDACIPRIHQLLKIPAFVQPLTFDALGSCAQYQGRMDLAIECFQKALALDPDYVEARNRIIMIHDAQPETTQAQAQRDRERWWQQHGAPRYAFRQPHGNTRDPERPLRIGYVSGDFQYHSAAQVFHRIALAHSDGYQPYFYSSTPYEKYDSITNSYRVHSGWRDVVAWPDALVADKIRDDGIDILVDLSGYTAHNRLLTFCFKPAPIQLTGWGYATGTGWIAMDGLIADRIVVPEDRQSDHVERIVYLPCVIDYDGTDGLPEPNPLPCLDRPPTFGVFQRSLKINSEDVEVWRQILERLPEARLIFKGAYCESLQRWLQYQFGALWRQVEVRGITSAYEHKLAYQEVDLSLDPWPQTSGVSGCDSLWSGVPEVTLIGPRIIQRTTASLLTNLDLPQFIAETPTQYIQTAIEWVTTRREELNGIRLGLRDRFRASPIHAGYLEATERAYRELWREWCAQPVRLADARKRLALALAS